MFFEIIGWTIIIAFTATTIITLLALTKVIELADPSYLRKLFTALILEIVAIGFFVFKQGVSPEQQYFRKADALYGDATKEYEAGNLEESDRLLGEILSLSVADLPFEIRQVFRKRGEISYDKKLWQQASQFYGMYYELEQDDLDALNGYGRSLRELQRYEEAGSVYERALQLSPNNYDALNGLQNVLRRRASFLLDADRRDSADELYERARGYITSMERIAESDKETDPETSFKKVRNAHLGRAALYWSWRKYPEAIEYYRDIIRRNPEYYRAQEDLAALLVESGDIGGNQNDFSEGREIYRRLNSMDSATTGLSDIFVGSGFAEATALATDSTTQDIEDARTAALLSITKITKTQEDPYPYYAAALIYKRLNNGEQAEKYLNEAIRHERRRATDPYTFDYVRLIKYEKLLTTWQEG